MRRTCAITWRMRCAISWALHASSHVIELHLNLTVMELSPLLRESTGSSLSSSELLSSQSVPGFEFKLRTSMGGFFSFPFLPFLWSALDSERQTLCKCLTFALITFGLDRATFVRSMSVCSTTSVAAESFCLWSPRSVHVVDLDRVFSGALRQKSRFLHGRFCIPHNSHGFCQVKVFLLEQFLL